MLFWAIVLSMGMMTGACSWIPKGESAFDTGMKDRGVASWYGEQFHGRQAANGELFDMNSLTAAHRTIPLGSVVRVVNLENGKVVHVRINDRGPYVDGRILDLSRSAAGRLGMAEGGLSKVQVEIVGDRRLDWLIPSDARPLISVALLVMDELVDTEGSHASTSRQPDHKVIPPIRFHQDDAWIARRGRRIPAILAVDHPAHTELAALVLG
jgi:rare lipoprotein A